VRVLIADDDRDTVMTLGILLRSEGHEVWLTQRGVEVSDAVRHFKPRVVLLDIGMPDRSGYDVAEDLSRQYGTACPILIAVSGHCKSGDKEKAEISGFQHLVPKPYEPDALLGLIDALDV
jgi:CheY-like chemotaxis protein